MPTTCGKCHRPLSDPKSIERGYGPECWASISAGGSRPTEASRSDYDYHYAVASSSPVVIIEDLDSGGMSVTNNIEAVVKDVCAKEGIDPHGTDIIYRDSDGNYDAARMDESGNVHIYALRHIERPRNEQEALEALRQQQAASNDTPNH